MGRAFDNVLEGVTGSPRGAVGADQQTGGPRASWAAHGGGVGGEWVNRGERVVWVEGEGVTAGERGQQGRGECVLDMSVLEACKGLPVPTVGGGLVLLGQAPPFQGLGAVGQAVDRSGEALGRRGVAGSSRQGGRGLGPGCLWVLPANCGLELIGPISSHLLHPSAVQALLLGYSQGAGGASSGGASAASPPPLLKDPVARRALSLQMLTLKVWIIWLFNV